MEKDFTIGILKPGFIDKMDLVCEELNKFGLKVETLFEGKPGREFFESFYEEHRNHDYYKGLIDYMVSGKLIIFKIYFDESDNNKDVIKIWREYIGPTNPKSAISFGGKMANSFRARFCSNCDLPVNGIHGSDSIESAKREMELIRNILTS